MKKIAVIFLMMSLVGLLSGAGDETPAEVDRLLDGGQYSEVLSLLSKSIRKHAADPPRQALYIKALGDFYRDICGNMNRAGISYRRIINGRLPADHPLKQAAREAAAGIKALETKYREENARLKTLMARANRKREPDAVKKDISQLQAFIRDNPGYYLLHEVYYTLGLNYRALKEHGNEYRSLKKAMEIKPGIVFYLAVKWPARRAYREYIRATVNSATRGVFWVLAVITMVVFYAAKPWKWPGVKHIIIVMVLVLSWWIVFNLSHVIAGAVFENSQKNRVVTPADQGKDPEYPGSLPGSPGSEVMGHLFWYGVIGVVSIFIFSMAMRGFKYKKLAVVLCCTYGFLLFSAFSTLFYMKYCDRAGTFEPGGKGIFYYLSGGIHLKSGAPETHILTDPLSYPGLDIENISDPYLRDWVIKYCPSGNISREDRKRRSEE
jgi:tetratricopeptide (TPR) repeat protein